MLRSLLRRSPLCGIRLRPSSIFGKPAVLRNYLAAVSEKDNSDRTTLREREKRNEEGERLTTVVLKGLAGRDDFSCPPNVTIVRDAASAARVSAQLRTLPNCIHACDTEVYGIDLKRQSPVGHGTVSCASIYCGPDHDFGNGPRVWIDNLDDAEGTLEAFKDYFEDPNIFKVWHNYSFDRHILYNHNINCKGFAGDTMHMARLWDTSLHHNEGYSLEALSSMLLEHEKRPMKKRFGRPARLKDGSEGKLTVVPSVLTLHRTPEYIHDWIDYSTYDAEATWLVRKDLEAKLRQMRWKGERSMWYFYWTFLRPFGELLTDMERIGIRVDCEFLARMEKVAEGDVEGHSERFRAWASQYCADAVMMNPLSGAQKQQFFFAPCQNSKDPTQSLPSSRVFKLPNNDDYIEEGKKRPLKTRPVELVGQGMPATAYTTGGWPSVSESDMRTLCGKPKNGQYGTAFDFYGGGEEGKNACEAIESLCEISSISTLVSNFIIPLQEMTDDRGRVHCSMNLNTETGRLSCRRPNLQNQPALEKDRYKVRQSFCPEEGNRMIVADYGQLELRLLAHMTGCKSMIEAFNIGGDFHSRTAMGMYGEIAAAVERGDVLLEWDFNKGDPPAPLLKKEYSSERQKAKILNFSIAYGKTPIGLAQDWNVSMSEAKETLELWYADRPEVKQWQEERIAEARETGYTRTLMGRYRKLPHINSRRVGLRKHSERAAINTPLQGGAADIVMKAMLAIHHDGELQRLGWKMLLQIHDELVLEGPEETAEKAKARVVHLMANPLKEPLRVELVVDAAIASSWMEGK